MSARRALIVGNCDPDFGRIAHLLRQNFDVEIVRVMHVSEAVAELLRGEFALAAVNRRVFADDSDGLDLVRAMKAGTAGETAARTPVMLISNFEEAQAAAVAAGAVRGFGKAALDAPQTVQLLAKYLGPVQGAQAVGK